MKQTYEYPSRDSIYRGAPKPSLEESGIGDQKATSFVWFRHAKVYSWKATQSAFHRPSRWDADCVCGTAKRDNEFAVSLIAEWPQKRLRGWKADGGFGNWKLTTACQRKPAAVL